MYVKVKHMVTAQKKNISEHNPQPCNDLSSIFIQCDCLLSSMILQSSNSTNDHV